jgi:penicillin-binding protein 2
VRAEDSRRIRLSTVVSVLLFLVLAARLWQLQIVQGAEYMRLSYDNRLRIEKVPAPRGIIYDRNGKALVKNSAYYNVSILPEMLEDADIGAIADFIGVEPDGILGKIGNEKHPLEPIVLREGLSFAETAFMEARLSDYPALTIVVEETRHYPYGEVSSHLVGYLGRLNSKQAKRDSFKDVPRQAFIGQWGIEKMFDSTLRGTPGARIIEVDALGRHLRVIKETPPVNGDDVYLSIDIDLQKEVAAAFGARTGAFMAIRPSTGEVLGLLSMPSFDPNLFSRGIDYSEWTRLTGDRGYPMLNRALQSHYPPGSTFKIITALAALEEGAITPETNVTCTGGIRRGRWSFGCWRKGGHGRISLRRAIVESCDVYFYHAGKLVGIDGIARYARLLGLGRETGIGLLEEKEGLVPDTEWKMRAKGEPWYLGETFNAAIGQGFVLATPAQLARIIGVVASRGVMNELQLTRVESAPPEGERLKLNEESVDILRGALMDVVNTRHGTAWASRSKVVRMGGKTGTSQVIANKALIGDHEEIPYRFRDHSWFVAFAPEDEPEIALAVFVEHGGHGSEAAAPIARRAVEVYMRGLEKEGGRG